MRKVLALTAFLSVLSGCETTANYATTANYEKIVGSWVGDTELDLVRKWGPPQQTYEAGGRKFLVYSSSRNVYRPGLAPSYKTTVIGNTAYTNSDDGIPGRNIELRCQTTFEVSGERIVSWSFQGNDCTQ